MNKFLVIALLVSSSILAQGKYFKGPNGKIYSEASYLKIKRDLEKTNKVSVKILSVKKVKDSVINSFEFTIEPLTSKGEPDNPYAEHQEKIGKYFPIEKFSKIIGKQYNHSYLNGKPTVINFWFTGCTPCIEEIPRLNMLAQKFKGEVNFIAITFDDSDKVRAFCNKRPFNFTHLTGAKKQIQDLKVSAYPMTVLLDRDRKIVKVYGEISDGDTIMQDLSNLLTSKK